MVRLNKNTNNDTLVVRKIDMETYKQFRQKTIENNIPDTVFLINHV